MIPDEMETQAQMVKATKWETFFMLLVIPIGLVFVILITPFYLIRGLIMWMRGRSVW